MKKIFVRNTLKNQQIFSKEPSNFKKPQATNIKTLPPSKQPSISWYKLQITGYMLQDQRKDYRDTTRKS